MKKSIFILLTGLGLLCSQKAEPKEFKEHITREFTLTGEASNTTVHIYNFSGSVKIEGIPGNKVIMEIDKIISADADSDLETGRKELKMAFGETNDSIIAYIAEPFDTRPRRNYNFNNNDPDYEFSLDFTVKVPAGINLRISTVIDGIIEISNVGGKLHVNNVNESISITGAKSKTYAHTVNGDVIVTYVTNPSEESSYHTINGDIRISYKPDLSADITFKSMHGDLYTDFPDAELLPVSAIKVKESRGGNIVYKLNKTTTVRFGKGGKTFRFETLNGDVYIKKQS